MPLVLSRSENRRQCPTFCLRGARVQVGNGQFAARNPFPPILLRHGRFRHPGHYKDFRIKPVRRIRGGLGASEWPNIERILLSLALKTTTQRVIVAKLSTYRRKNRTKRALWEHAIIDTALDWAKRFFGIQATADDFLEHRFRDLARYYAELEVRKALRRRLREAIDRADGRRVMVIAHSMGSIVAYDALRELGRERPNALVEHLVTIGSPLGLPHVKLPIREESGSRTLRTPSVVRRWSNLAKRRDPVAFDNHLAGDYRGNFLGVRVQDDLVCNDRDVDERGKPDVHSSIGYLPCPEMSRRVREFI
jgi:pimeloyl-ACP methyl ester carboxylesterase